MLFIPKLIIAFLAAVQSVAGFESSSESDDKIALIREPQAAAPSRFRIYDAPVDVSHFAGVQQRDNVGAEQKIPLALAYLEHNHGIQAENVRITASVTNEDTGVSHVYARQTVDRVDMLDGVANINIDKHGRVISSSQTFAPVHQVREAMRSGYGRLTARSSQYDSLKGALKTLCKSVESEINDQELNSVHISAVESDKSQNPRFVIRGIPTSTAVDGMATAQQSTMRRPDGSLAHVWDFLLEQADHSWNARISIATGGVESLVDRRWRSGDYAPRHRVAADEVDGPKSAESSSSSKLQRRLSYVAIPITWQDPREGFEFIVNPESASSPYGWVTANSTAGNNAIAFKGSQAGVASETSPYVFAYSFNGTADPRVPQNVGAAIVNAFYVVNSIHDISYIYGFTEATFNFQDENFGRGGQGNDRITISIQDSAYINYADFATPPDGQSGRLRLFIYDLTHPDRDGGLENDIIAHECAIGIATRLTGGGTAACLQSRISRGMALGWGDAFAEWLEQTGAIADFTLGSYVTGDQRGIRSYPYSRSPAVNPLTYQDGPPSADVHLIGEVWANMLHNVLAALTDNYGWSDNFLVDSSGPSGNVVYMHLYMDGLSIQPCEPTFITARDAFIQAELNRYGGRHYCVIWRVFASKGLGYGAYQDYVNEYSVPPGC